MKKGFIYLASASPRRAELLERLGVAFRQCPADLDEAELPGEGPAAYVTRIAAAKAAAVAASDAVHGDPAPVLGADTVVVNAGKVLGKPGSRDEALAMLAELSGRTHEVLSAVAVTDNSTAETRLCVSKVRFRATTAAERAAYCATEEPYDKAGAYGIQGFAAAFVEHLEGSYTGVMGLPLFETAQLLAPFAMPGWLHAPYAAALSELR